jgi:hypothetical protein
LLHGHLLACQRQPRFRDGECQITISPRRSEDIAGEIVDRAYDADETLTEGTKRFIDRQLDIERRPRAPSVLRDADIVRKKPA